MATNACTRTVVAILAAASFFSSIPARAAVINWGNPQTISGDTDVLTSGTLVAAYSLNAGAATVNGVAFANGSASFAMLTNATYGTNFLLSGFASHYALFGAGTTNPFAGLSVSYKTVLSNGIYAGSLNTVPVVTATNLIVGHQYLLQVWGNDSRSGRPISDTAYLYGLDGGSTVNLQYNDTGAAGGLGQFSIGTFTADGTSQAFTIYGDAASGQADTYLNAVQIRDQGVSASPFGVGYWNGLAGNNTFDFVSLNFSTNAYTAPLGTPGSLTALEALTNACYFGDDYYANSTAFPVTATNINVAAGGVSIGSVNFVNTTNIYTLTSSDANGIMDGSVPTVLNKYGTGKVILDGVNSYSGGTFLVSGTLQVGNGDAQGTLGAGSSSVVDDGSLVFDRSDNVTNNNNINGYGTLTQAGSGTLVLNGSYSYTGATTILSNGNNVLTVVAGLGNGQTYSGAISIGSNSLLNYAGGGLTLSGVISGAGSVADTGGNTLVLSGANTFADGATVANTSTLQINSGGTTTGGAGRGPITLSGNSILTLSMGNSELANVSVSGGTQSTMNVNLSTGNEWLTNNLSGFQGTVNVNYSASGGQLVVGSGTTFTTAVGADANWQIYAGAVVDFNGLQTNPAAVYLYGFPYASAADGALRLDESVQTGPVFLYANTEIGNGNSTGVSTISGVVSDGGGGNGFVKMGAYPIVLTAANTYGGATIVSNGTLSLSGAGSIADSSAILLANGTTFNVSGVSGAYTIGPNQVFGNLGGSATINGSLTLSGGAPLSLTNTATTAPLIITNGTLTLNNNPITVTVSPLDLAVGTGSYLLISGAGGASPGAVAGNVNSSLLTVNGLFNNGGTPSLLISNSSLYLVMNFPVTTYYSPVTYSNLYAYVGSQGPAYTESASGPNLSYQWYTNGVAVAGANSTSFMPVTTNLPVGELTNAVVVSNSYGVITQAWVFNVLSTNGLPPYAQAVLASQPYGFWRLDEPDNGLNNGNAGVPCNDYVGGHYGVYTNVILGQTGYGSVANPSVDPNETAAEFGKYATTYSYAGIPGINFAAPSGTAANLTVEAWVNAPQQPNADADVVSQAVYSDNDVFDLQVNSGGSGTDRYFRFLTRDAAGSDETVTTSPGVLPNNTWQHWVGVCNQTAGTISIYLNGKLYTSAAYTVNGGIYDPLYNGGPYPVFIGGGTSNYPNFYPLNQWTGAINDVAIYTNALTAAQIAAHYAAIGEAPSATLPSSTNIDQGGTLVLTPSVTGTSPIYSTWTDNNAGGAVLSTNQNLTVNNIQSSDTYYISLTNEFGTNVQAASESVNILSGAPQDYNGTVGNITVTPAYTEVYAGTPVKLSIAAYGTLPIIYQWSTGGHNIAGATNSGYTVTNAVGTTVYTCVVSNSAGHTTSSATLVGVTRPTSLYATTVLSNNPIAYWRLDEPDDGKSDGNTGTVAHDYVGQHDATYYDVALSQPGHSPSTDPDTAALFGAYPDPDYVGENNNTTNNIPYIDFVTTEDGGSAEFSVEAWVKTTNSQADSAGIVAKGYSGSEQFTLDVYNNDFRFFFRTGSGEVELQSSVVASDGNWHHLVGICDQLGLAQAGGGHFFVDGQDVADGYSGGGAGLLETGTSAKSELVSIGARTASVSDNFSYQFNGTIDEVALYAAPLSAAQILSHYEIGTNVLTPTMTIENLGSGNLQVNWNVGALQTSTNLAGPWETVTNAAPYNTSASNSQQFFRVQE